MSTRRLAPVLLVATLALVPAVFSACSDDGDGSSGDGSSGGGGSPTGGDLATALDGNVFVSTEVSGYELVEGSEVTLTFDEETLGVTAGCNSMGSAYTVDGTTLQWTDQPMSTLIGCEADLQAQDEWIAALLTDGVTASLDGDQLTLTADDVTVVLQTEAP
jgi:heat shock protein HslJ